MNFTLCDLPRRSAHFTLHNFPAMQRRSLFLLLRFLCLYFYNVSPPPLPLPLPRQNLRCTIDGSIMKPNFNLNMHFIQLCILVFGLIFLICLISPKFISVRYVTFNTNLSTLKKNNLSKSDDIWPWVSLIILGFLLSNCSHEDMVICVIHLCHDLTPFRFQVLKFCRTITYAISFGLGFYLFLMAVSPLSHVLSLAITLILCRFITRIIPNWVFLLLLLLANDIEFNPGPHYHDNFFSFMNWNLNSLAKNNFERIKLIEAHNSLFNYDLISLCETCLNDSTEIPDTLLKDYTFISANHPDNLSHGGVGLFYKNSLPLKNRSDLAFDESIVIELKFGRKKIFFTVVYRSPSFKHNSPEFANFLKNCNDLHSKIQEENPYATFFTGDFNGHSQFWWPNGDTTPEGKEIEELFSSLSLSQVISEPTNFTPGKNPSCIDLIVTDQPNIILDSGTRASLDSKCHHQIIHG